MTPLAERPTAVALPDLCLTDLLCRALAGLSDGLMPGARLETLIDRMEMRK